VQKHLNLSITSHAGPHGRQRIATLGVVHLRLGEEGKKPVDGIIPAGEDDDEDDERW
jgi:hypothetical protein